MKTNDNANVTASPRGGVGSNVTGTRSTATRVKVRGSPTTSAHMSGEPATEWSEGRQESECNRKINREEQTPAQVPERDKQAEEDLWQRYGAERGVWTEAMLKALEKGVKGSKWLSLTLQSRIGTDAWDRLGKSAVQRRGLRR